MSAVPNRASGPRWSHVPAGPKIRKRRQSDWRGTATTDLRSVRGADHVLLRFVTSRGGERSPYGKRIRIHAVIGRRADGESIPPDQEQQGATGVGGHG